MQLGEFVVLAVEVDEFRAVLDGKFTDVIVADGGLTELGQVLDGDGLDVSTLDADRPEVVAARDVERGLLYWPESERWSDRPWC